MLHDKLDMDDPNVKAEYSKQVAVILKSLVQNFSCLQICSDAFRKAYYDGVFDFYKDLTMRHCLSDILWLGWSTWDNYSVSVLFLGLLCSMYSPAFSIDNAMMQDFFSLLVQNIHYDWRSRNSVEKSIERMDVITRKSYHMEDVIMMRQVPCFKEGRSCPE